MTDVPGHSRGLIQPLAKWGVTLLDIGVNSASTPPDVPDAFVWKDPSGAATLTMLYHQKNYGGVVRIPRSDLAIAVEVRDDNSGPHTIEEVREIYAELRRQFPAASIVAANLTDIANAVEPFRGNLPIVSQEIGDTWIHGVASDPVKLARIRELQCGCGANGLPRAKLKSAGSTDLAFLSKFTLAVEHTWGTDTKTWLDFESLYTPDDLASMLGDAKYRTVTGSWVEKRADINDSVAGLPNNLRDEAEKRLAALNPAGPPDISKLPTHPPTVPLTTTHFSIAVDPATGAITELRHKERRWASPQHPLALLSYQTLSKADYDKFLASYITVQTDWAPKDFGKPNLDKFGAESRVWTPKLAGCWAGEGDGGHRLVARLQFGPQEHSSVTAWPQDCYLDLRFPKEEAAIHIDLTWETGKALKTALPEAPWLSFNPRRQRHAGIVGRFQGWGARFAVRCGQRGKPAHARSFERTILLTTAMDTLRSGTPGMRSVRLSSGEMCPIYFSKAQPDLSNGVHFNLFNNGWGTNYVQWFGEDMRFRFVLRVA